MTTECTRDEECTDSEGWTHRHHEPSALDPDYCERCGACLEICDEGRYCDRHLAEAEAEWSWLRGVPKAAVMDVEDDPEYRAEMRDAGRGHLLP